MLQEQYDQPITSVYLEAEYSYNNPQRFYNLFIISKYLTHKFITFII